MKYNRVDFGTTEAVFNKLGGIQGIRDFLSEQTRVVKSSEQIYFKIWKKLTLGNYKDLKKLCVAINSPDCYLRSNWNSTSLNDIVYQIKPSLSSVKKEKILLNISPKEMGLGGFFSSPSLREILNRAKEIGVDLCEEEDVFELGIQFTERAKGRFHIYTKKGLLFDMSWLDNDLFFGYHKPREESVFQPKDRFIFCIPETI